MTKHKHCEIIIAWANGIKIEYKTREGDWVDAPSPSWSTGIEYRVKPQKTIQMRPYLTCAKAIRVWTSDWERTQERTEQDLHFSKWLGPVEERTFDV